MAKTSITTPGLANSIKACIDELKQSGAPAIREMAEGLEANFGIFVERVMDTIDLARSQRDAAYVDQAELLATIHEMYPNFARTLLLIAAMPRDDVARTG